MQHWQLVFDGQQLEDKKLVFDYNIQSESTLDLLPHHSLHLHAPFPNWIIDDSIIITIRTLTWRTFQIHFENTNTIEYVKSRIQDMENIPTGGQSKPDLEHNFWQVCFVWRTDQQRLISGGKQLEDGHTISDCGIQEEAIILLVPRLRGGGSRDTKKLLGLVDIAQAISLCDWDGIMPGHVSLNLVIDYLARLIYRYYSA